MKCAEGGAYESDIREQFGEYPDAWRGDDDSDDVENEAYDREGEEETDEAQHADREVPHPEAHDGRPEREHHARKHDRDHGHAAEICRPLRALVEPRVVVRRDERLHLRDLELFRGAGGGAGRRAALDAEEEGEGDDGEQQLLRFCLVCDLRDVLELRVRRREQGLHGTLAWTDGMRSEYVSEINGERGAGLTLEVIYAFSVEHADSDLHPRAAATQEVDDIADVLGSLGLLLHRK